MTDRPYDSWSSVEWSVLAALGVTVVVYVGASVAAYADVSSADTVATVAAGLLWLVVAAWLVVVQTGLDRQWSLAGAAGLVVAGATELALVVVASPVLETLNLLGLLVGIAVLLADLVGVL